MTPPTITTTLGDLVAAEPALGRLAADKLPFKAAYRVAKLAKAVAEETKHFHEQRNVLVREYGEPRPGGTGPDDVQVLPTMGTWAAFIAKVQELAAVDVRLDLWPIDLDSIPDLTITPADLLALGSLVADGDGGSVHEPKSDVAAGPGRATAAG